MPETEVRTAAAVAVRVCFFARYRELTGTRELRFELPAGSTVSELVRSLRADSRFAALPPDPLVAVNREYADGDFRLADGDEVAMIPPVSGG